MSIDWDAAGFFLALVLAVASYFGWTNRPRRHAMKVLNFKIIGSSGRIKDSVKGSLHSILTMEKIMLRNNGATDLKGIQLRLSPLRNAWSTEIEITKTLAKEAVRIIEFDDNIKIEIDNLPPSEFIFINILSNDYYLPLNRLKSENSNVVLVEDA